VLHDALAAHNALHIAVNDVNGPLCYPLLIDLPGLRERLISQRIYVPCYWRDALARCAEDSFESRLVDSLVPLPCDQRYSDREMEIVIDAVIKAIQHPH
jgi:hypothetical protein